MNGRIVKRGKQSWQLRVSQGFDPNTGKHVIKTRTVRGTKRVAESELAKFVVELETGTALSPDRLTYAEYFTEWLKHQRTRVRPENTTKTEADLGKYALPWIGKVPLRKLKPAHIQRIIDEMVAIGRKPNTIRNVFVPISASLQHAVRLQLIPFNPAKAVRPPRAERSKLRIPTPKEMQVLLKKAEGTPCETAVMLAMATGARRNELLALRWEEDVDLNTRRVRIKGSLKRRNGQYVIDEPKTARGRREIVLPSFAVDALRKHRTEQAKRRLALGELWHDDGFVFDSGDGTVMRPSFLSKGFRKVRDGAGLKGIRFHDLRHGYASALMIQGVHPKVVSEALGHASVAFTLDVYSHLIPSMGEAAADAIDQAFR